MNHESIQITLGKTIKAARTELKLSFDKLSALSGVDRITIMRIEKGKNAKVDNFVKILIALNKLLRID